MRWNALWLMLLLVLGCDQPQGAREVAPTTQSKDAQPDSNALSRPPRNIATH